MAGKPQTANKSVRGEVLRWPTSRSRDWTESFLDLAERSPSIVAVVAVGSAVRPRVRSEDLDLVVIWKHPGVHTGLRPLEVDLRGYSAGDINTMLEAGHDLLGWAVRFGRVLFQREGFWDRVVESWHDRLPLPSSELAHTRAVAAYRHLTDLLQSGDADAAREQALAYVTHLARAALLERGVYPASRPELPEQLRSLGKNRLADCLKRLLGENSTELSEIDDVLKLAV